MKIMAFRRRQKRKVVPTVVDGGADDDHSKPKPCHCKVRSGHYRTSNHGTKVDNKLLEGVAVDGSHTHWGRPLVMCLVNILVELWMMKEPAYGDSHKINDKAQATVFSMPSRM